jgi:hypothetical protein
MHIFCLLQLDSLTQQELASRLTLNCMNCYVEPQKLSGVEVTIMDVSMNVILVLLSVLNSPQFVSIFVPQL